MTAIDVCYCVLILSGAFALVCLGILLLRSSITVKQVGNTVEMAQSTIDKAEKIMDDVTYKLDLLNAPVESIARFFDPNRPKFNPISGIGTVIGMLLAPKKGSELRDDLKEKSQELYDKAQNMTKEDFEDLINNTIEDIKLAIDEFDVEEFKESTGTKLTEVKAKLEQLANSVKSSDEYANFKASVVKVGSDLTNKLDEIKMKIQDKDFDAIKELDDAMDDIEDELDVIIEDLKD